MTQDKTYELEFPERALCDVWGNGQNWGIRIKPEVEEWLDTNTLGKNTDYWVHHMVMSERVFLEFKNPDVAMRFKLTFGGE